jgi:hypothetical protein
MTCEVKLAVAVPSHFDPEGHRFPPVSEPSLAHEDRRSWRHGMRGTRHFMLALLASAAFAIAALAQGTRPSKGEEVMLDPQALADRYVAVWNERDEARRRDAIAGLWVPDGQHYVGEREARGHEALEKRIRGSHEKNVRDDGNRFRAMPGARRLRNVVTFYWEMLPANADNVLVRGLQFLILDEEGRILIDYQFFPA